MEVKGWSEKVIIPTYEIGKPEKNPIFLEKRVYQGSSGAVYPYPVIESISDTKVDKEWNACYLENDFIKIMILPELGGRVQMAYDKLKKRHFVYYNEVIKPALVGLTGPWISGGIEFNWPQHHRPSTYDPVDFKIEQNSDGSVTVWCSEIERMFRTKGMAGFTLHPDKAYLEIRVKLYNRTSQPQTFLWWANPAVHVNDEYQSVFPPDVNAVFDHGKRDVSTFPIATGTYYKMDYSAGVDISRYKNIPVPTSYMAIKSDYNFVGGYENDSKGGLLHVANHHISPGKKQWTWGQGDFGQAWDRNLTDNSGPYIELMCGVYTDNQPDFSWLMPFEQKEFTQYFMPYRDIGVVKNATKEGMINMEFADGRATLKAYTLGIYSGAKVVLTCCGKELFSEQCDLHPDNSFEAIVDIDSEVEPHNFKLSLLDSRGKVIVDWSPEAGEEREIPEAAKPAKEPHEITSIEQLFLRGQHLEQYRHATYSAVDYYMEALKREPGDVRCNNAMGLLLLRKGQFEKSEQFFKTAYETQIERNPNPYDGEPLFNLGCALRYQERDDEAFDYLYKSVWNAAWMDSGYFHLSQTSTKRGDFIEALDTIDRSLIRNWHNHKGRHLKIAILRKLDREIEALALVKESLLLDQFNFGVLFESYLLASDCDKESLLIELKTVMRDNIHNYIEIALDYYWAGLYQEGIDLLNIGIELNSSVYPLAYYYRGWFAKRCGLEEYAKESYALAEQAPSDYCFPNQLESVMCLTSTLKESDSMPKAAYYLGNFWYSQQQYSEAVECWELSRTEDDSFPTVWRNLALAYYNKCDNPTKAVEALEIAFDLDSSDSRVFMELDQLHKKLNRSPEERLKRMESNISLVEARDDQYLEWVNLYNLLGDYGRAYELIMSRQFHPWEGGEGKVTGAYLTAVVERSKSLIGQGRCQDAIDLLNSGKVFPHNLGEGKLTGAQENDIDYWLGCAYYELGLDERAYECWRAASTGISEPTVAWFYNDAQPDKIFYQGLALKELGSEKESEERFNRLISYGEKHKSDDIKLDYFAVSLPDLLIWEDSLTVKNSIHCYYMIGLGQLGLGKYSEARDAFSKIIELEITHQGALIHLSIAEAMLK